MGEADKEAQRQQQKQIQQGGGGGGENVKKGRTREELDEMGLSSKEAVTRREGEWRKVDRI